MTKRQSRILLACAGWTFYVWISRLVIMSGQDNSLGFNVVHGILAVISIGFGVAVGKIGWDAHRRNQQVPLPESWNDEPATGMKLKS
ncbi:MAG TPA: hypothetical protein VHL53_23815 [Acidimicrobiia bacterium]|nr:hypothetical protein [Acidimicrobiia bacterium]